jgi:hypothetical protein
MEGDEKGKEDVCGCDVYVLPLDMWFGSILRGGLHAKCKTKFWADVLLYIYVSVCGGRKSAKNRHISKFFTCTLYSTSNISMKQSGVLTRKPHANMAVNVIDSRSETESLFIQTSSKPHFSVFKKVSSGAAL